LFKDELQLGGFTQRASSENNLLALSKHDLLFYQISVEFVGIKILNLKARCF